MTRLHRIPSLAGLAFLAAMLELGLRSLGLLRLCDALGIALDPRPQTPSDATLATDCTERVARCALHVNSVVNRFPQRGRCLRRSLLLGFLLRDLRPTLCIGVAGSAAAFDAHAWLEIEGHPVGESISPRKGSGFAALGRKGQS